MRGMRAAMPCPDSESDPNSDGRSNDESGYNPYSFERRFRALLCEAGFFTSFLSSIVSLRK